MSDPNDPTTTDHDDEALIALIRDAVFPMTIAKLAEASPLLSEHKIHVALDRLVGAGVLLSSPPEEGEVVYTIAVRPGDAPILKEGATVSTDAAPAAAPSPDPAAVAAPPTAAATRQALLEQLARTAGLTPEQRALLMGEMGADAPSSTITYEERRLMVELSADKKAALGRQLADKTSELEEIKEVHKERTAHFTAAKKDLDASIAELSRAIRRDDAGSEELSVRVAILPYPEHGYRDVFRLDAIDPETGKVKPVFVKREALPKPPPEQAEMFPADSGEKAPNEKVAPGVVKRKAKGERKAGPFKVIDGGLAPGPYKAAKTEEVEMDALTKALSEVSYPIEVEPPTGSANDTGAAPAKDEAPVENAAPAAATMDGSGDASDADGSADDGDDVFDAASDDKPDDAPPPDETPAPKGGKGKGGKGTKASKAKGKKK